MAKHIEYVQKAIAEMNPYILLTQEIRNWEAAEAVVAKVPDLRVEITSRFQGDQQQVIVTKFPVNSPLKLSIDQCCMRPAPRFAQVTGISNVQSGVELSDHFGLLIEIVLVEIPAVDHAAIRVGNIIRKECRFGPE